MNEQHLAGMPFSYRTLLVTLFWIYIFFGAMVAAPPAFAQPCECLCDDGTELIPAPSENSCVKSCASHGGMRSCTPPVQGCGQLNRTNGCRCDDNAHCASNFCSPISRRCENPLAPTNGYCLDISDGTTGCNITPCADCYAEKFQCAPSPGPNCAPEDTGGTFSCSAPLVPCGRPGTPSCDLCYLYNLASNVVNYCLFCLILPIAAIALLFGGIFMLASMGNPQKLQTGKMAITNTVIGVVIAFSAWLVIGTILNTLGYDGFTPAWNQFPGCVKPIGPAPIPTPEQCTTPGAQQPCTTTNGTPGARTCGQDNVWSVCREQCARSEINRERDCKIAQCDGTQICIEPAGTTFPYWSDCQKKDTKCVPTGGGRCPVQPNGYCSISDLQSTCFSNVVTEAAQICWQESSGDPTAPGDSQLSADGVPLSIGLFQILLPCNKVGGLACPTAFEGFNGSCNANKIGGKWKLKTDDTSQKLYQDCVMAAKNPGKNVAAACQIYADNHNSWSRWSVARTCGLR